MQDNTDTETNTERGEATGGGPKDGYGAIFHEMSDAVFLINVEKVAEGYAFTYRRTNASHQQRTGLSEDEVRGETPQEVLGSEQGTAVERNYRRCVEQRETTEYEERLELPGGTSHWQTKLTPIVDSGQVTQIVGVARDITEQKDQEQNLQQTHRRFETVMETMPAAVFLKDIDGQYLLMNQACRELFNVGDRDITGLTDADLVPSDVAEKARTDDQRVIENGEMIEIEETVPSAAGNTVRLTRKSPVHDDDGDIKAICGVSTDITEQKEREQELQRLKDQFELAVEGANIGIWDWDVTTDEIEFNDQWAEMLGYERDELEFSFDTWDRLVHPDDLASVTGALEAHIDGQTDIYSHEIRMQTKAGDWKWIRTAGRVVDRNEGGSATRAAGVHIDINDRKQTDQKLERTSEFLKQTQEVANVGGWEVDMRTESLQWTDEVYRIHGEPLEYQPTVEDAISFYHPDDRDTLQDAFEGVTADGEPYDLELRIVRKSGEIRWVRTRGEPWYQGGDIIGVRGTFQDITERKERETELRNQNERLDEFAGLISHDLRNPLTVALGRTTYLQQSCDGESAEQLDVIAKSLNRMEEIIDDTLTLARKGETVGDTAPISLLELCGNCWQGVDTAEATLDVKDNISVNGDDNRLKHVFENLFRNAIEHSADSVTVRIGRHSETGFYVEDDGPGIPEDVREDVFEAGHTSDRDGTGLGLAIVKRIAEAHGWEVAVTDGSDGGARFEFEHVEFADSG